MSSLNTNRSLLLCTRAILRAKDGKTFRRGISSTACVRKQQNNNNNNVNNHVSQAKRNISKSSVLSVIRSDKMDLHIPEMPLTEFVLKDAEKYGDKPALVNALTGESYKFSELRDTIWRVTSGFARHGVRYGDIAMVISENSPEYVLAFHAIISLGGTVTMANPLYGISDIAGQAADSNTTYILTSKRCAPKAIEVAKSLKGQVKKIFVVGEENGCVPFSSLLQDDGSMYPSHVDINPRSHVALLPYSSGTTGLPKGVMLSHYCQIANTLQCDNIDPPVFNDKENIVQLAVLPFYHIYAIMTNFVTTMAYGQTSVIIPGFDPKLFLEVIQKHKVTLTYAVPPMIMFLNRHPLVANADLSSLTRVICGAAPLGPDMVAELHSKMPHCVVGQAYGMTETSPAIAINPIAHCASKPSSSGVLVPNTEMKVYDSVAHKECDFGEVGELCVRGPQVMLGYINNPKATSDMIDKDGWLHTGDVGYVDETKHVYLVDRVKELIKYKGLQVPPAELEAILCNHPSVADAAVVGLPDDEAGELPRAYVALKQGANTTATELIDFVDQQVVSYKKLRGGLEFLPQIPRSAAGKILRKELRCSSITPSVAAAQ